MTDTYTPMRTLKEVREWAKSEGLIYYKGHPSGLHCLRIRNTNKTLIKYPTMYEFKFHANALRKWHLEAGMRRPLRFRKINDYWVWVDDNGKPVINELVNFGDWLIAKQSKELIQHLCDKLGLTAVFVEAKP